MATPTPTTQLLRPKSYPYCGRLIVLETGRTQNYDPFAGLSAYTAINFPAMPDSIELARSVDYLTVNSQVMPDGIHQYRWTNPLSIPFSFKLHSFDKDYCPRGARSLLEIAALLHAMTAPISASGQATKVAVTAGQKLPGETPANDANAQAARAVDSDASYRVTPQAGADFSPPVTVRLELIFVDEGAPGIVCNGYLKDVKAKLNGPWLRGPNRSQNLPTSGDFEFTFVHAPGYGNNFSIASNTLGKDATMAQAYAHDLKTGLYNTRELALISERDYKGFTR